jgi:hypothetical protein
MPNAGVGCTLKRFGLDVTSIAQLRKYAGILITNSAGRSIKCSCRDRALNAKQKPAALGAFKPNPRTPEPTKTRTPKKRCATATWGLRNPAAKITQRFTSPAIAWPFLTVVIIGMNIAICRFMRWRRVAITLFILASATVAIAADGGALAVIDDRDGYTNIRSSASKKSKTLGKVVDGEQFTVFPDDSLWWRVRTKVGVTGFIHRSCVRMLAKVDSKVDEPPVTSGDAFDLVPGSSQRARPPLSPAETYLRALEGLNSVYFLGAVYTTTDRDFMLVREHLSRLVAIERKYGEAAPEALRGVVRAAIVQDITLGELLRIRARINADSAWDSIRDSAKEALKEYLKGNDEDIFAQGLLSLALNAIAAQMALERFGASKSKTQPHARWERALKSLESSPGGLIELYQSYPALTDPTWQFIDRREAGDRFFAPTFNSRSGVEFEIGRARSVGDLGRGPIRVDVPRQKGRIATAVSFRVPPGGLPRVRVVCRLGHLGASLYSSTGDYSNRNVAWAARGIDDPLTHGVANAQYQWGNRNPEGRSVIVHLPMLGEGEDAFAEGTVYIYLGNPSIEELERADQRSSLGVRP